MKTKEEILEQVSGLSIDFIKEHHDTIPLKEYLEAMEIYAQQQVKNLNIPAVIKSVCEYGMNPDDCIRKADTCFECLKDD